VWPLPSVEVLALGEFSLQIFTGQIDRRPELSSISLLASLDLSVQGRGTGPDSGGAG
jgi:hypothetical protein